MRYIEKYIEEISRNILIVVRTKQECSDLLSTKKSNLSYSEYTSWVLDFSIIGINQLYDDLFVLARENGDVLYYTNQLKEVLYNEVINSNEFLCHKNIYITKNNTLTLRRTKNKLINTQHWSSDLDNSSLVVIDSSVSEFFQNLAITLDPIVETTYSSLLGLQVEVNSFQSDVMLEIIKHFKAKNNNQLKWEIISLCINSLDTLITKITTDEKYQVLGFNKLFAELYDISTSFNTFLSLQVEDVKDLLSAFQNEISLTDRLFDLVDEEEANEKKEKDALRFEEIPTVIIKNLNKKLKRRIFGQDESIDEITQLIIKSYFGLRKSKKPIASFLLFGGTSNGKTQLAKELAAILNPQDKKALISIPCATVLQSAHSIQSLIGSPPSYVGYEDGGLFSKNLTSSPQFKVILFDEIDKAHPRAYDVVLEMLDEGQVVTSDGSVLDVTDCIIIFTSNTGSKESVSVLKPMGFKVGGDVDKDLKKSFTTIVKKALKPEFLARLNKICYFNRLTDKSLLQIIKYHLIYNFSTWSEDSCSIKIDPAVYKFILKAAQIKYKETLHARNILNCIDELIFTPLSEKLVQNNIKFNKLNSINVKVLDKKIEINFNDSTSKNKKYV